MTIRNFYSGGGLDRDEVLRRDPDWLARVLRESRPRIVPVWRSHSLVIEQESPEALFLEYEAIEALLEEAAEVVLLGRRGEEAYLALDLSHHEEPPALIAESGGSFSDLRAVGPLLERWQGSVLAYARGLIFWHSRHRFCGLCGAPTVVENAGHQRRCTNPGCNAPHFPRTDPAVIMLVHDGGDRCLLGRQKIWPPGMHSTLAGFVEPGESLEEAVAREVYEEVGIEVEEVTYHSSQPWPFPSSIMLGFHARADYVAPRVDEHELESAQWYDRETLLASPEDETFKLPRRDSIARQLILSWLEKG